MKYEKGYRTAVSHMMPQADDVEDLTLHSDLPIHEEPLQFGVKIYIHNYRILEDVTAEHQVLIRHCEAGYTGQTTSTISY